LKNNPTIPHIKALPSPRTAPVTMVVSDQASPQIVSVARAAFTTGAVLR
jgi:hypothetical protein